MAKGGIIANPPSRGGWKGMGGAVGSPRKEQAALKFGVVATGSDPLGLSFDGVCGHFKPLGCVRSTKKLVSTSHRRLCPPGS